jgi:hypothetical protein
MLFLETSEHDESQRNRIDDSIVMIPSLKTEDDPCQPYVRLPEVGDFRFYRPIIMDEGVYIRFTVQLPGHQQRDPPSLLPSPDVGVDEEWLCHYPLAGNPAQEAFPAEAVWNEIRIDRDNDNIFGNRDGDIPDSESRSPQNGPFQGVRSGEPPKDGEDLYRSRTSVGSDSHCLRPFVRLSRKDNRPYGLDFRFSVEDPKPLAPVTTSKEYSIDIGEDMVARSTVRFPDNQSDDLPARQELDELSDEQNDDNAGPSRVVQPPMNDYHYQLTKVSNDDHAIGTPRAPIDTSKDRMTVGEDTTIVEPVVVRLPERQDLELSLSPSLPLTNIKKTREDAEDVDKRSCPCLLEFTDPVEDACLAEAAWSEEVDEPHNHYEDQNSNDIPNDKDDPGFEVYEVFDSVSDGEIDALENLSREEPRGAMEINDLCLGTKATGILDRLGHMRELNRVLMFWPRPRINPRHNGRITSLIFFPLWVCLATW